LRTSPILAPSCQKDKGTQLSGDKAKPGLKTSGRKTREENQGEDQDVRSAADERDKRDERNKLYITL